MNRLLTTDQHNALSTFAEKEGRTWKAKLKEAWSTGAYPRYLTGDEKAHLQRVRNVFGQVWLTTLNLATVLRDKMEFDGVKLTLTCNDHGYADYDVEGHPQGIRRVKILPNMKKGERFNAYSGRSSKNGVEWLGSIEKTLHPTCLDI